MKIGCDDHLFLTALLASLGLVSPAPAGVKSKAVRETAEYVLRKFEKQATGEGLAGLTRKIELLAARHGEEALVAVKKVGPQAFRLVEEASEYGPQAVRLMARSGDEAIWIISRPRGMAIFVRYGEDAAMALVRHRGIAEPLIEAHARPAVNALKAITPRNGRRIAMLEQSGELARMGRTSELLEVVGRHGDRAMDFVWKHKGALAVTAGLAAFLANPEPFLNGTRDITRIMAEAALHPLTDIPSRVAVEAARGANWTPLAMVALLLGTIWIGVRKFTATSDFSLPKSGMIADARAISPRIEASPPAPMTQQGPACSTASSPWPN